MTTIDSVLHIMLIEDEQNLAESIVEFLEIQGHEVTYASNGKTALEMLDDISPDIILCDIAMPEMDGLTLLKHVRNDDRFMATPFIFITARGDKEDLRKGMQLGADDYLTKPFRFDEILQSIKARIKRKEQFQSKTHTFLGEFTEKELAALERITILSKTELKIFKLICEGKKTADISDDMFISKKTVENHRYNIMRKLGITGQGSLLKFAVKFQSL